jgi:hypothetical protein
LSGVATSPNWPNWFTTYKGMFPVSRALVGMYTS